MSHVAKPAFWATAGSRTPRIVLVGEAWGQSEDECKKPFAGESGKELFRMLGEAMPEIEPELHTQICGLHKLGLAWVKEREQWFEAAGVAMTNILAFRPPANKIEELCGAKKEVGEFAGSFPALSRGKYLREEFLPELDRLWVELDSWRPNLVVALGNTACWALLQTTNIGSIRGAVTSTVGAVLGGRLQVLDGGKVAGGDAAQDKVAGRGQYKCLPTYHPAGVLRNWSWRPIVVADLMKGNRESRFPEIRRPKREILVSPTLDEMEAWEQETYQLNPPYLAPDIETAQGQITCIGFARSPGEAMVIPFWDRGKPGYSYWPDHSSERRAVDCMARLLTSDIPKVFQNGIYDVQYITRYGIRPKNMLHDTMLLHHSMYPELQKGLGFLGSVYTNESSWKLLRKRKADSEKKDE